MINMEQHNPSYLNKSKISESIIYSVNPIYRTLTSVLGLLSVISLINHNSKKLTSVLGITVSPPWSIPTVENRCSSWARLSFFSLVNHNSRKTDVHPGPSQFLHPGQSQHYKTDVRPGLSQFLHPGQSQQYKTYVRPGPQLLLHSPSQR